MGYVTAMSPCVGCRRPFSYNPMKVPSLTPPGDDTRRPICPDCVERFNVIRKEKGLPLIEPLPGAYEAADESEMIWGDDD